MKYVRFLTLFIIFFCFTTVKGTSQRIQTIDIRITFPELPAGKLPNRINQIRINGGVLLPVTEVTGCMEQILKLYEDSGYPFVSARLDTIGTQADRLQGTLIIEPGQRITIDTVLNRTGYRISQRILYRITNIHPGDIYSESAIQSAAARLRRTSWLTQKRSPEVGFHEDAASLFLYPDKASSNRFDGWAGLSPAAGSTGKMSFAGALDLGLQNILGQGESWSVNWRRNQDKSQQLKLGITLPWLAGLPFGFQTSLQLYRQDTSYLNLVADIGVPYYFSPENRLNLFYRVRQSTLLTDISSSLGSQRQSYQIGLTGLSWNWIHLDNVMSPTSGWQILAEASTGRKQVADSMAASQSELYADMALYIPVRQRMVLSASVRAGSLISSQILENESFRIGGVKDLRGFDEDFFRTDRFLISTLELRYLLDNSSYLLVLADAGMLHRISETVIPISRPLGIGLGGQLKTSGGIFRIIFALGKEPDIPFNIRTGKIHIGYVGLF